MVSGKQTRKEHFQSIHISIQHLTDAFTSLELQGLEQDALCIIPSPPLLKSLPVLVQVTQISCSDTASKRLKYNWEFLQCLYLRGSSAALRQKQCRI